ncbi:MAG: ammonium transporter [Victivallales bacterium]|nr:ammonium transporter [Victivallales bacterium]
MKWKKGLMLSGAVLAALMSVEVFGADAPEKPLTLLDVNKGVEALQINLNIVWTCIAAFLVFFMQAGFAMVESGFTRAKNSCNIMMKNLMDFSIGTIMWFLLGFGFMFGAGNGFIGMSHFAATDFSANDLNWTFWIFQCVFAGTAATIVSGAMAERTKFSSYLIYSAFICAIIYPISGHWMWGSLFGPGSGWLEEKGFMDFAGSTVVHSCGAWLALAGAITLGPRIGKYSREGKSKPILGHNIPIAALGVFILWFGWFGFNPGSTTTGDSSIGYIAMTTNLAAAGGAIAAMIVSWIRFGKPDVSMSLNGVLAGLVAITAGCNDVTPTGAIIIGLVAGILVVLSVEFIDKVLKIDDPVGAVSVHGVCGVWGTLALCFFLKDGSEASFAVQLLGVGSMFVWAFGAGLILFNVIKYPVGLRASEEDEVRGLDLGEHGNEAYSGFQIFISQ